jgi:hypothetical protein
VTALREYPFVANYAEVAGYNRLVPAVAPADHPLYVPFVKIPDPILPVDRH